MNDYARSRQLELAREIHGRCKVYLDARYWIILRETDLGTRTGAAERELLRLLRQGVAMGELLCPMSGTTLMELIKQPNTPPRRGATAALIDELSLGISIIPADAIIGTEIHSLLAGLQPNVVLHPMQDLIWTKAGHAFGNAYPAFDGMTDGHAHRLQASFFDRLWNEPVSRLVAGGGTYRDAFTQVARDTNRDCSHHASELGSFEGTYEVELRGAADALMGVAAEVVEHLARRAGAEPATDPPSRGRRMRTMRDVLYRALRSPPHRVLLRSIRIEASLHAAMRWDKRRTFKPNDFYDFHHASAALAYCDAFLTEEPLREMIQCPRLDLEAVNGCRVASAVEDAVEVIRGCIPR